ncbi:flagellar hook-associated protein FlgL [Clostridium beijerinckii]|uniref:Flagellar hook-associated protein 3 FlgL n=1 Tax=Clostridium beijerinckii TaxID=1520 RepID=A0A9Q5CJD8_CLOBE|nr:flagellar hook-associated protein FlgL [Clostridium beijerinckii]AQS07151.1 flagellar filament 41 kDa core protein [Clostridium beijerinckii]MBA2883647.1 flagellar hook-associated protein 3 FlgL [Clostridium beijerinckii]MBA2898834.1 flagellar hook-associated protein 3 FlgL [Clostridium beijerinckii]MBA2908234.1 flagellar hook-associated protein 3 FlgL [Clostridium beijerinckii]MBA9013217.1 flagellar hook-associated protein 3 FlgL [Clostridium beijerinckii]
MSSRITSNILTSNYLRNMKKNLNNMKTLQNQLASGKTIQKASENPYTASRSMQLNTEMSYNKQYNENIKDTSNWLDTTDTALAQMGNVFGRIETLLVSAGNGAYGEDQRAAIQDEVKEKVNELSQILNTSFDGSYIFGGTKTGSKPTTVADGKLVYADQSGNGITKTATGFSIDTSTNPIKSTVTPANNMKIDGIVKDGTTVTLTVNNYSSGSAVAVTPSPTVDLTKIGTVIAPSTTPETLESLFQSALSPNFNASDANQAANSYSSLNQIASGLQVDISQGVKSQYNKTASEILEFTDKTGKSINVSELLNTIINDLGTSGNTANLTTTDLKDIQSVTTNLLQKRSEVGTMQNRMDSAQGNNETENYNMTDILSKTEDVDYAEATMNYSMMQTVYTASLQTSAKILPMTILSYL